MSRMKDVMITIRNEVDGLVLGIEKCIFGDGKDRCYCATSIEEAMLRIYNQGRKDEAEHLEDYIRHVKQEEFKAGVRHGQRCHVCGRE